MNRSGLCLSVIVAVVFAGGAGCRDKQPYPDAGQVRQNILGDIQKAPPPVEPQKPEEPQRLLALLHTARGTTIVSGQGDGRGLAVRQVMGFAWAMNDGTLRVVKPVVRASRTVTSKRRSFLAGLSMEEYGRDAAEPKVADLTPDLTKGWDETEQVVAEAVSADPDMAGEFYYVEQMKPVGSSGPWVAWLLTVESYLGGAHPVDSQKLIVVDVEKGAVVDTAAMFPDRDIPREVLGDRYDAACVRKLAGVAPFEGTGGGPVWAALLTADFGVCEGQWQMSLVKSPGDDGRKAQNRFVLNGQSLELVGGRQVEKGVVDFRTDPDGSLAVLEMALGARDARDFPWADEDRRGERTREFRFFSPGMERPAVISRLPELHSVQFVPAGESAVAALATVKGLGSSM